MLYDAIVVGSGPAGAIAASHLASRNKSTLLVDSQTFPRDKVCGDGMPMDVMRFLKDMGIPTDHHHLQHHQIVTLSITSPSGIDLSLTEKSYRDYSMVSKRFHFDALLHQHAVSCGAIFEQARVTGLIQEDGKTRGVKVKQRGTTKEYEARSVIVANGSSSLWDRVNPSPERIKNIAIRAYATSHRELDPTVRFFFYRDLLPGYVWLFPTASREANIGIYLSQDQYKRDQINLNETLLAFVERLKPDYHVEIIDGTSKTWSLPIYDVPQTRSYEGSIFVGDAGYFINALTGGGIYPAMQTGLVAAQAILDDSKDYEVLWQQTVKKTLNLSSFLHKRIATSAFMLNSLFAMGKAPFLRQRIMKSIAGDHY